MMLIVILVVSILLLLMGLPLYVFLFGLSFYFFHILEIPFVNMVIQFEKLATLEFVTAVPLFAFSGYVLSRSKSPDRILFFFNKTISVVKGSESVFVIILLVSFTALTGSSGIGILALGGLLMPILRKSHFNESFSLGLITSSGSLGLLFVPSLPVIIYAIVSSQNMTGGFININLLFKVALLPLFILIVVFSIYSFYKINKIKTKKNEHSFSLKNTWEGIKAAKYELLLPMVIYGGIYSGFFSVMETSAIIAFYVFSIVFVLHKDLGLKRDFIKVCVESAKLSGVIFMVILGSMIFKEYFIEEMIPDKIFSFISPYLKSKILFLLFVNFFLLIAGCFLDIFSAILIILPILLPIVEKYQIDPYHFAIIFLVNLEIGYLTPPIGMNLFIASYRFKKSIFSLYKASFPFLILMLMVLMLLTYYPWFSTFLISKEGSEIKGSLNGDRVAPGKIESFKVVTAERESITFSFKSVGDDGKQGVAAEYDLRYSDFKIDSLEFFEYGAEEVTILMTPQPSGMTEIFRLKDLRSKTTYFVAVRAIDEAGNKGPLSSIIEVNTK